MAETERFELSERLPARRLSKALVSATHPRLRKRNELAEFRFNTIVKKLKKVTNNQYLPLIVDTLN